MNLSRRSFVAGALASLAGPSLLSAADVAWLKDVQRPQTSKDAPALPPLLVDVESGAEWRKRRAEIEAWWHGFLHPLDLPRGDVKLRVLEEDRRDGVIRQLIEYENEPGQMLQAYLLRPLPEQRDLAGPRGLPGVVVLHSTNAETIRQGAGLGAQPEKAFGLKLAKLGCVALCPMNFLWAEPPSEGDGRGVFLKRTEGVLKRHHPSLGMAKMLWDSQRALDVLEAVDGVDRGRLGCVGHSLGGKEALYLPAFDPRIKAAVSSEGGVGLAFSNWHDPWYLNDSIKRPDFGHDHHELLALIAPRAFLLVGGDSADGAKSWPYIEAALPVYELYGKPAKLGLLNHGKGHSVPPEAKEKIAEWLVTYLAGK